MNERIAKPVVKNKFWVVEDQGHRVATIQATVDGGFVYVHDEEREHIPSLKLLKQSIMELEKVFLYYFPLLMQV